MGNKAFPPPSPPCNFVPLFELPIVKATKTATLNEGEWVLRVEIVLKTKQPEAETSLVYDVFIRVIRKESAS